MYGQTFRDSYHLFTHYQYHNSIAGIHTTSYFYIHIWSIIIFIHLTFNNLLKATFSNKKYPITIQTDPTPNINSIFLINSKPVSNVFLKIIGAQNQLPITFCTDIVCSKTLNARNSIPSQTNFEHLISLLCIISEQKFIRK